MSDRLNEELQQKAVKLVEGLENRLVEQISSSSLGPKSLSFLYSTIRAAGLNPESQNDWFFIEEAAKSKKYIFQQASFLSSFHSNYILMPKADTYAQGVHALQKTCVKEKNCSHPMFTQDNGKMIYRPLTFKENIEARVHDYETLKNADGSERTEKERLRLFSRWLDSCTGIAYKTGTTRFKIIPICEQLITIKKFFANSFLQINYDHIEGVELDNKNGKYNNLFTQDEVLEQPAWRTAVDDDKLLKIYSKIVFDKLKQDKAMGFGVEPNKETDELRALWVNYLDNYSNAFGGSVLNGCGSFLLVAPSQKNSIGIGGK